MGQGPSTGRYRVLRGGCWYSYPGGCRSANRLRNKPDHSVIYHTGGFRVVLEPDHNELAQDRDLARQPEESASTSPQLALENMRSTLLAGDKEAFVDCFDTSPKLTEILSAFCEFASASIQLDQATRDAYGQGGVEQPFVFCEPNDENWLERLTIQVEGDTATAVREGQSKAMLLVKKDGLWKIDAGSIFGGSFQSDENIEMASKMLQLMAKRVTDVKRKIGQPGYTAKKINQEFKKAATMTLMP